MKTPRRGRRATAVGVVLACVLASCSRGTLALDPALDVSQLAHTTWKIRDGFSVGDIQAIAQTPDGYLWLGTQFGLSRFDGVRNVQWLPPGGELLPNNWVRSLLGARDGTLWIGTLRGLASWNGRKLTTFPELADLVVNALLEDREGTVWVATVSPPDVAMLCAIRDGRSQCAGKDGEFGSYIEALYEDSQQRLWVGSANGLWRWRPRLATPFLVPPTIYDQACLQCLTEETDGRILIVTYNGLRRLADGKVQEAPVPGIEPGLRPSTLLRDHQGGLWIGTLGGGLLHVHDGRTDLFRRADGLSGDRVLSLFEDREGDIWVATDDGLDRFREYVAARYSVDQAVRGGALSVLADNDGSVWLGTGAGLQRWDGQLMTVYRERRSPQAAFARAQGSRVREILDTGVPENESTLFQDHGGRIWVGSTLGGLGYLQNDRFVPVSAGQTDAFAEDSSGNMWIANRDRGLQRSSANHQIEREIPWAQLGHQDPARRLATDAHGGLWLGFLYGGVAYLVDGSVRASYSAADGLGKGLVLSLRVDGDDALWVGTESGLSRIKGGRINTLSSQGGLPCDVVDWTFEDDDQSVWLYMGCGIVRVARSELDAWVAAVDAGAQRTIRATVFGSSDGVRSNFGVGTYTPHVAKARDGKLYFATADGVTVIDPRHVPHNALPPPVHIEQIVADRKPYKLASGTDQIRLPPLVRDLQIDYTALSLVAPEKMQFRYQLEGHDPTWQEAGTRRQAFYTDLPPGDYRFRVIASNNDDVWNEVGASLDLSIAPTFFQTRWFIALCVAAGLVALWLLYAARVRQLETRMQLRLDERVAERERIARDLHDTFLQSVQGLILKFQAVMSGMPSTAPSRQMLEQALERADEVIVEGRNRVQGLRASSESSRDLSEAFWGIAEEFAQSSSTELRVTIRGAPRELHPIVSEEAYRIGAEGLRNAFRHAAARHIDIEIEYDRKGLSLRINDDGRGFDVSIVDDSKNVGHFGLRGLRERARKIHSHLEVSSAPGSGTAVELRVPASIAYASARPSVTP